MRGAYDLHIHVEPDVIPRRITDLDLARRYQELGLAGFVLKSHYVPTAERAAVVRAAVPEVRALGAIVLNNPVGGLNPIAVEIAARGGARIVWMPTVDAANEAAEHALRPAGAKLPLWARLQDELRERGIATPPVLLLTMPEPAPVALVGELLATQARARGVAAILVDAAVRDVEELRALGLPIWARWVRVRGAAKTIPGELHVPVVVGGATIRPGDVIVLDADGAVVVAAERAEAVLEASLAREAHENGLRATFATGQLSIDIYNLRDAVRAQLAPAGQDERSTP